VPSVTLWLNLLEVLDQMLLAAARAGAGT
jgi:hypothetical protein